MARIGMRIIFEGHFIPIFKYLCSSLSYHWGVCYQPGLPCLVFYLFVELVLLLYPFPAFIWWELKKIKAEKKKKNECCNVVSYFYRKSLAPSSGNFRRRPPSRLGCRQDQEFSTIFCCFKLLGRPRPRPRPELSALLHDGFTYILPPMGFGWLSGGGPLL